MKPTLAILAGLFALSATPVLAGHKPSYAAHTADCVVLFFTDQAQHSQLCTPSRVVLEAGSIHTLSGPANVVVPDEPEPEPDPEPEKCEGKYES